MSKYTKKFVVITLRAKNGTVTIEDYGDKTALEGCVRVADGNLPDDLGVSVICRAEDIEKYYAIVAERAYEIVHREYRTLDLSLTKCQRLLSNTREIAERRYEHGDICRS